MHNVPTWPASTVVAQPDAKIWVNGTERTLVSVSLDKSMGSSLLGGGELIATTGDAVVKAESGVTHSRQVSPWSPLMLRTGQSCSVEAGYLGALAQQFIGVIDGASGGADRDIDLQLVDDFDKLDQTITLDPLLAKMPPFDDGGGYRYVGVTPTYVTSTALRKCGYYATPPMRSGTVLSAPMNGSLWAEHGEAINAYRLGDANALPDFVPAPWGQAVQSAIASYKPASTNNLGQPLEIRVLVGPAGSSGSSSIVCFWGASFVRLMVSATRQVDLAVSHGGTTTTVCTLTAAQMAGGEHVTARATAAGAWSLTADNGKSSSGSAAYPFTTLMDSVRVSIAAASTPLGGVLVGYHGAPPVSFVRSAKITPAAYPHSLSAMPAVIREKASDLLRRQAAAELAALWLDDWGAVRWVNRLILVSGNPVKTITSMKDLLDLQWEIPPRMTAQKVVVKRRRPVSSVANRASITVYEGSADSMTSGQSSAEVIETPTGEDWVMPDLSAEWLDNTADRLAGYNRGRRTWVGMVKTSEGMDGKIETWVPGSDVQLEKVDPHTFIWNLTAPTLSAAETVETRAHADDPVIWSQYRSKGLPLLRAYGKCEWVDEEIVQGSGNEYSHDAEWFIQHPTGVDSLVQAISNRVNNPQPTLANVPIVPDTRLERGDIVTLDETHKYGVNLRCLVEGINLSCADGEQDMSVTLRVLSVNGSSATYEELERAWQEATYAELESQWGQSTYQQFENDPLRRA